MDGWGEKGREIRLVGGQTDCMNRALECLDGLGCV